MADEALPQLPENVPPMERAVRVALSVALLAIGAAGLLATPLAATVRVLSIFPLVTGLIGWCPLHQLADYAHARAASRAAAAAPTAPLPEPSGPRPHGLAAIRRR